MNATISSIISEAYNRVVVFYYGATGHGDSCVCPDCANVVQVQEELSLLSGQRQVSSECVELLCRTCGIPVAMISSPLESESAFHFARFI